jgi:peptide alpha-N-acetyltransferase
MEQIKEIEYLEYVDESMISDIQALVSKDLSEPYSIFTYRYFLHNWPSLCICAYDSHVGDDTKKDSSSRKFMIGTIVCKAEDEQGTFRGYIAMLAVNSEYRKKGIGAKVKHMYLYA